uniref:CCDC50_N domain-containing protein n=1 Tax=Panagrellus redivivus TaxID=6233 RepID=A0A7E4VWN8_PANRE
MNQQQANEIERDRVRRAAAKLRENEDFNLAMKLQEAEFEQHYDRNRTERRVVGSDTRVSRVEQEAEKRAAMERHLQRVREQAAADEELARRLQAQLEEEDLRRFANLTHNDAALARRLSAGHDLGMGSSSTSTAVAATVIEPVMEAEVDDHVVVAPIPYDDDERLARELQERYLRRVSGARGALDRRTQQELQFYVGNQTLPHPSTLSLTPRRNSSRDLGPPLESSPSFIPDNMTMPPLPSYTEACTPTTTTSSIDSVLSRRTVSSISATTTASDNYFTTATDNRPVTVAPVRPPLQPVPSLDSPLPDPPAEILSIQHNSNFKPSNTTNHSTLNPNSHDYSTMTANLHPTNPFLQDLMLSDYTSHNPDSPLAKDAPNSILNGGRRLPEGAVPILPGLSAEQLANTLPRNPAP